MKDFLGTEALELLGGGVLNLCLTLRRVRRVTKDKDNSKNSTGLGQRRGLLTGAGLEIN